MNDLNRQDIPIVLREIGSNRVNTISARDLWRWLEVGEDFSNWIKRRLEDTKAIMDLHYAVAKFSDGKVKGLTGTAPQFGEIEYYLTFDLAVHISMLERTEKGHQIRQYFIDVEKSVRAPVLSMTHPETLRAYAAALEAYAKEVELSERQKAVIGIQDEVIAGQEKQLVEAAPTLDFHAKFENSNKLYGLSEAAIGFGLGPYDFIARCAASKVIRKPHSVWMPYSQYQPKYLVYQFVPTPTGRFPQTFFTEAGRKWIAKRLGLVQLTEDQKAVVLKE